MKIKDLLQLGYDRVNETNKEKEAAKILLAGILKISLSELFLKYDNEILESQAEEYLQLLDYYVLDSVPVQYLVGFTYFYGRKFIVDERVLIPRPETERLVDIVTKKFPNNLKVLEIGTGSGVIATTLALEKNYQIDASDIDPNALNVAAINAKNNGAEINFILSDIYDNIYDKYDLIISNPPYVSEDELIDEEVEYEPETALFSGNLGLNHIYSIIIDGEDYLNDNGMMILEHGHKHGMFVQSLVHIYMPNYRTILLKDLAGKNRYTIIKKRRLLWKEET